MQNMLFNDLTKRLSDFLMEIYERDNDTEIKITQEEIAKNIGSSREGVSRMLKKFEKEYTSKDEDSFSERGNDYAH